MNLKVVGGVLMILGTSIGAGMLALPVAAASAGFITSALLLVMCWLAMTIGAFLILEVVLWLPEDTNMISMARLTLGKPGQIFAWLSYLLLLYSLLCAYISGNSDVLQAILQAMHIVIPRWAATILIVLILGSIVYRGIYSVDIVNRSLMSAKLIIYVVLVLAVAPYIHISQIMISHSKIFLATIMVMITSFGFAIIVPSLRTYFNSNVRQLRKVIIIGSLIPLIFYIIWIAIVQGVLPVDVLQQLAYSTHTTSGLANHLSTNVRNLWIASFIRIFTSICALTSFLGVSLSLFDFLADGLKLYKKRMQGALVGVITFLPATIIILFAPGAFIHALAYAGIFCIIILILLPSIMAWRGRYNRNMIATDDNNSYQVWGGKTLLAIEILFSVILIGWNLLSL